MGYPLAPLAGLEQGFLQPLLLALGWKLKYQTWLQGRKPDYALFLNDPALDAALRAGRKAPEFWNHPTLLADAKAGALTSTASPASATDASTRPSRSNGTSSTAASITPS